MTSAIIAAEVDPTCHALGPVNKLVFAPGLLAATNCANSGRISVGAKSPLTGGIKEANSGGQAGQMLGRLGVQAIVVEGAAEKGALPYPGGGQGQGRTGGFSGFERPGQL